MNKFTQIATRILVFTVALLLFNSHSQAQCSGVSMKVVKDSIGVGNVKYTYYVDKDSSCAPYRLKLKLSGYPTGMVFKYYIGNAVGITSSNDTFSTVLINSGYYNIKVELINNLGNVYCTMSRDSMIRAGVGAQPKIGFFPAVLCNGSDTVSIIDSTPGIVARIWKVDGVTYSNNSPIIKHRFKTIGCKTVEVFLTSQGDSCQLYKKYDSAVCIYNAPIIDFSASPTSGCKGFITSFTPNITPNGNTLTQYDWTFNGGTPATYSGLNPGNDTFSSAGAFDVKLDVKTSVGCSYSLTKTKFINVGDTFDLKLSVKDSTLCVRQTVVGVMNLSGLHAGGNLTWSIPSANNRVNYGADSVTGNYIAPGIYNVTANYSYNNCKSTKSVQVRVIGPATKFSTPLDVDCGVPATFKILNNTAAMPGQSNFFYWRVSDSAGRFTYPARIVTDTLSIVLTKFGKYSVKLYDSSGTAGCIDSVAATAFLQIKAPTAAVIMKDTAGAQNYSKQFCTCDKITWKNATSKYTNDTVLCNFTLFYKLDTTQVLRQFTVNATKGLFLNDTITYRYCDSGRYICRLVTFSKGGCIDTVFDTVRVAPPKANFVIKNKNICKNGSVTLNQATTPYIPTLIHKFYYKHADSTKWVFWGTGASVNRSFTEPGAYSIAYSCQSTGSALCRDSIVKMDSIYVNDIAFDFKSAAVTGCIGSVIKFDTMKVVNIHPGYATSTYNASWTVTPSTGATIANDTMPSTNITFTKNGVYDVELKLTDNKTGCSMNVSKSSMITIGITADFSIPGIACYKTGVPITNSSTNSPKSFLWGATPATVGGKPVTFDSTSSGASPSDPIVSFPDSGCYMIKLTIIKGACTDTISKQVCIERVVPKFSVNNLVDTINQCAPKFVKFRSSSIHGSYHYWSFGDGNAGYVYSDTTDNVYRTNDSCFDVRLVAISSNGCQDTLTKYCYIQFQGPVPKYTVNKTIGCEPLNVTFTDQSYNIVNRLFDYGDGNTTSSSNIANHTYYSPTPGSTYDIYVTSLTAYSSLCGIQAYRYPDPLAGHKVDTILVYKKAKVGFYLDSFDVCQPQCVQFHDTSRYVEKWKWYFGDGQTDTVQNPVHCYAPGTYTVALAVNNAAGCGDSTIKTSYITVRPRSKAAFSVNDSEECTTLTVNFTDKSTNTTTRSWDFGGNGTSTATNPSITFAPGKYTIKLVTNNAWGCSDSVTKDTLIKVFNKPVAKLYSNLTTGCEPFTTTLYGDSSLYSNYFVWYVMKGATKVDSSKVMNPNFSLKPGTYTVKLYTANVNACYDSMIMSNYITVYDRAKPQFTTLDTLGCDTINAQFTNASTFANSYIWSFGDGQTSTATNPMNGYGVGTYSVKLWANNANNCFDSITKVNKIMVVNKPKPKIWCLDTVDCEPYTAQLHGDSTLYANSYFWYLGNSNSQNVKNPVEPYSPGIYSVKLVARNSYGCSDSITKTNYITVYKKPTADFNADILWVCYGQPIIFTDLSITDVPVAKWLWNFGDSTTDTLQAPAPHIYTYPGNRSIKLMIENSNGCKDTVEKKNYIYMDDNIPPVVTQIQYVTFNNGNLDIFWEVNTDTTFAQNKLYRDDPNNPTPPGVNVYTSNIATDVTYTETAPAIDPTTTVYSYSMTTSNACNYESAPGISHRNMVLTATTKAAMTNLLTWTPYVGWGNNLKEYQIWKGTEPIGAPVYNLYRTVSPSDTSFVDSLLCDSDYYYQIYAIHKTQNWQPISNPVMNHPPFISPDTAVSVAKSTVIDNRWTYTNWKPSNHPAIKNYVIDKYDPITGWQNSYAKTKANVTGFLDVNNVNVQSTSYAYRVSIEDYCGNVSPTSADFGKTILLDAGIDNDYVVLKWSPYEYWANGIREYEVQINYGPGDWRYVATIPSTDTQFTDKNVYEDLFTNYCYRVVAYENDVIPDTSISNNDCAVVPSRIWIPNSFSPNGKNDPRNEIFKPSALSIYSSQEGNDVNDYVFKIYNRWGELVFETHNLAEGWDGTFKGKPMPVDIYTYTIRARGRDGFPYDFSGSVHLMR